MPRVEIVQKHNTAARRLYIRGHNGKIYPYLVMNDACLTESRREERVLQLLRLLNPCLEKRKETTKRHLFFTGELQCCGISVLYVVISLQICSDMSPVDWPRQWPCPFVYFVSLFQLAFECCFLSCCSLVVCLHPDVCQLSIYALISLFETQMQMGNSVAPQHEFPFIWNGRQWIGWGCLCMYVCM